MPDTAPDPITTRGPRPGTIAPPRAVTMRKGSSRASRAPRGPGASGMMSEASRRGPARRGRPPSWTPALPATRAAAPSPPPILTAAPFSTLTRPHCSRRASITPTVRFWARCTSTALSSRAGCTAPGSLARTVTNPTRSRCASPGTCCAPSATFPRSSTRPPTIIMRRGPRGRGASPATCRHGPT